MKVLQEIVVELGMKTSGSPLALIGNASEQIFGGGAEILIRGVFDKEVRRKPLAFAADAVRYGISTAVRNSPPTGKA